MTSGASLRLRENFFPMMHGHIKIRLPHVTSSSAKLFVCEMGRCSGMRTRGP